MSQHVRNGLYYRLLSTLQSERSGVVYGTRLSGRSSIVQRLQNEIDARLRPRLVIHGIKRTSPPLYALRLALTSLGRDAPTDAAQLFSSLYQFLIDDEGILVVDNADRLDDDSLFLVERLFEHADHPCLVTTTISDARLTRCGDSAFPTSPRFELGPLDLEDGTALLTDVLDGTPSVADASRLVARAGGIPGLLVAMTRESQRAGVLVDDGGVWRLQRDSWVPIVTESALALLDGLGASEREDLTRLALLGRVDGELAERVVDQATLANLERHGFLYRVSDDDGAHRFGVSVQPEVLAGHLRRTAGLFVRRQLSAELAQAFPDAPLQLTPLDYEDDHDPGAGTFTPEIGGTYLSATIQQDVHARLVVLREQWQHHRTMADGITLLDVMVDTGRPATEIRAHLAQTRGLPAENSRERVVFALRESTWLAWVDKDLDRAVERLHAVQQEIGNEFSLVITGAIHHLRSVAGVESQRNDSWPTFLSLEHPEVARAFEAMMRGRYAESFAVLASDEAVPESSANLVNYTRVLSRIQQGELVEAVEAAREFRADATLRQDPEAVVLMSNALALALILIGRLHEASKTLVDALALGFPAFPFTTTHVSNLVMLSILQARRGMRARALITHQQAASFGVVYGPIPFAAPELAAAFIDYYDEAPGAGERLWSVCEKLLDRGYRSSAICAWAVGGPWTEPQNATIAEAIHEHVEPLFGPLLRYQQAVTRNTKEDLESSYNELTALGRNIFAAGLAVQRMRLAHNKRDEYDAWMNKARELTREVGLGGFEALRLPTRIKRLSSRERQIFDLLAAGESNQEIGDRLFLTTRTVENHVFRLLRKLELRSRHDVTQFWSELSQ